MKYIQKKIVSELPKTVGSITDTLNVEDKSRNAPSINLVSQMAGVPTEGIIAYETEDGSIPEGYEEVENPDLVVYSTEEFFTGKYWIDGKKIYGKVIKSKTGSANADNFFPHNVNNLDHMTHHEAKIYNAWDIWNLPFQTEDTMFKFSFVKTSNAFRESHTNTYWNDWDIEIIFEYTKTTD